MRLTAASVQLDGALRANGDGNLNGGHRGAAGGSIWVTADTISGGGTVEANGGPGDDSTCCYSGQGAGGGGAVSIEYGSGTSMPWTLKAENGPNENADLTGGAGTVYTKGPLSVFGNLTIKAGSVAASRATELPALGGGVAQAGSGGATLVTNRSANIPDYFYEHWVEITDANGLAKGTWQIDTISNKTVTLKPEGNESINIVAGDKWQGVYRFDQLSVLTNATITGDPIRLEGLSGDVLLTGPSSGTLVTAPIVTDANLSIAGRITTPSVTAPSIRVRNSALVTGGTPAAPLTITTPGTLTIDAGGAIDVSGIGYGANQTYAGHTAATGNYGASHMGVGGSGSNGQFGSTFGSITRPQEAGGGSVNNYGGGALRIDAGAIVHDGAIRANGNGNLNGGHRGAGGGSIWITAGSIAGAGIVEANGGAGDDSTCCYSGQGAGGGGAVSIEYGSSAGGSVPWTVKAENGPNENPGLTGGAGTIFTKGPSATFGDFKVTQGSVVPSRATVLPSLGTGTAAAGTSGATLVTDRTADIPAYFIGHWVEIRDAAGTTLKGTYRIDTIDTANKKKVTLVAANGGAVDVVAGDKWQGVYRFDTQVITANVTLQSADPIRLGAGSASNVSTQSTQQPTATRPGGEVERPENGGGSLPDPSLIDGGVAVSAVVVDLRFDSSIAPAGTPVTATVVLSAPAPEGGAVVEIASDSPIVEVPTSVYIPAGALQATFTVVTPRVPTLSTIVITATYGASKSAPLTLTPVESPQASLQMRRAGVTSAFLR